jgi:hypothetical protein
MHGFPINSAPDDPELTLTRAWLALVRDALDAHSFRSLEKILKQRKNPRQEVELGIRVIARDTNTERIVYG